MEKSKKMEKMEKTEEYKNGDVYVCPDCQLEVTVTKACSEEACPTCGPLVCCDKPMIKK